MWKAAKGVGMKKSDVICSVFLVFIGLFFCVGALRIDLGTVTAPGSGFMPFGAAVLLILFSLATIGEAFFSPGAAQEGSGSPGRRWSTTVVLVMLFAYALLLDVLGFLVATFLLLTALFKMSEGQTWKIAVVESVATTAFTYVLFDYVLRCSFPRGLLTLVGF